MVYFTGDINLTDNFFDVGYGVGSSIRKGWNPFHNFHKEEGDVWIGNFEGVTSNISDCRGYRKNCFRIIPELIKDLELIDYWGLANNHVMEHGKDAFLEMEQNLATNFKGIFGSKNKHSVIFECDGQTVAVTGFSLRNDQLGKSLQYWNFPNADELKNEYDKISHTELKVAYIHWGVEFIDHPNWEQRRLAHWLIDLGYDLIIGMHPHVLQGYEVYNSKYIFYSLGNFVFNQGWVNTKYGIIVKINPKNKDVYFDYIKIQNDYAPMVIHKENVPLSLQIENLNLKIENFDNPEKYVKDALKGLALHRKYNHRSIVKNLYRNNKIALMGIFKDFIRRHI